MNDCMNNGCGCGSIDICTLLLLMCCSNNSTNFGCNNSGCINIPLLLLLTCCNGSCGNGYGSCK